MRYHLRKKNNEWSWSCYAIDSSGFLYLIEIGHGYESRSAWTDLQSRLYDLS
jgi:hypothetical protein